MTRMCSWPRADFGSGPTRSIPICSKGTSMTGCGMRGLGGGRRGDVCWQVGQIRQNRLISASSPGQWKWSRMRWMVFSIPKCPAIGWACASSMTVSVLVLGTTKRNFSSPRLWATQYFKIREGVWAREPVYLIYSAHLFSTVAKTVILSLLPAERTPGRDLLKHIKVDRRNVTWLTLTLPLGVRC